MTNNINTEGNLADKLAKVADKANKENADKILSRLITQTEEMLSRSASAGNYGISIEGGPMSKADALFNKSNYKNYLRKEFEKHFLNSGFEVKWDSGGVNIYESVEILFSKKKFMN